MRIINWNVNFNRYAQYSVDGDAAVVPTTAMRRRLSHLLNLEWDVLTLQEVNGRFFKCLCQDRHGTHVSAMDHGIPPRPHGAAVIRRNNYRIEEVQPIEGLPKPESAIGVLVSGERLPVRVVSARLPNAAGYDPSFKNNTCAALNHYLRNLGEPVIIGLDANCWENGRCARLELPVQAEPRDAGATTIRQFVVSEFFSNTPQHHLHDAFLGWLQRHPQEYARLRADNPDGPLAVSYVRNSRQKLEFGGRTKGTAEQRGRGSNS